MLSITKKQERLSTICRKERMISNDNKKEDSNMEIGLQVIYNKDKYTLIGGGGSLKEYPIGSLMCEFVRLAPTEIKSVIMACPGIGKTPTRQNVGVFLDELNKAMRRKGYDAGIIPEM